MTEYKAGEKKINLKDLSSFGLHILAMVFMLCDHLWATVVPGQQWLTWIGRLAFPMFAFMIVEGYFYTSSFKKYVLRIFLFALIAEIPFNLMYVSSWIYPFHQNVMWTFLLALFCIRLLDKMKKKMPIWLAIILGIPLVGVFMLSAQLLMMDYYGEGLLMVVVFYCFRGNKWYHRLLQFVALFYINWFAIKGMRLSVEVFGQTFMIPQQGMAVLALLPIWWYKGRQGLHNKAVQYMFYAFYPVHMLILGLLSGI